MVFRSLNKFDLVSRLATEFPFQKQVIVEPGPDSSHFIGYCVDGKGEILG